jgi:hypothetical protein
MVLPALRVDSVLPALAHSFSALKASRCGNQFPLCYVDNTTFTEFVAQDLEAKTLRSGPTSLLPAAENPITIDKFNATGGGYRYMMWADASAGPMAPLSVLNCTRCPVSEDERAPAAQLPLLMPLLLRWRQRRQQLLHLPRTHLF